MNESDNEASPKPPEQENSAAAPSSKSDAGEPTSLKHKTAGVEITVSIKDAKKGDDSKDSEEPGDDKKGGDEQDKSGEKDGDQGKDKDDQPGKDGKPKKKPIYKRPLFIIIALIVVVVLIVGGIILWLIARQYVSTDDAYIDGHVTQVSPRASAQVISLDVDDNQLVHRGDLLVELDPTDYQVALNQAQAQVVSSRGRLEQAQAQTNSANASVVQARAQVEAAEVTYGNATRDLERYQNVDVRARSQQQLDNAFANQKNAEAQLKEAQAKLVSAGADVGNSAANVHAAEGELATSEASLHRAEVNLSYCKIYAATDGRVTQRTVEVGNYVTTGQAMFMLVDPNVWVTANFKETQLQNMRTNQPVTIKVDAYPGTVWHGHIDSVQAGSGSRFDVLPAENATGNYVKIVQRVPVKIVFDHGANTNDAPMLSPGLSAIPRVKVR